MKQSSKAYLKGKTRYILIGGINADLHKLYGSTLDKTLYIFLKKGNFRVVPGYITINVQKQLMNLGVTYKTCDTHITAARIHEDTSEDKAFTLRHHLAAALGDKMWFIKLSEYGRHSVRINGDLEIAIRHEVSKLTITDSPWIQNVARPIHVELRPRLKNHENYVEVREAWYDKNTRQVCVAGVVQEVPEHCRDGL